MKQIMTALVLMTIAQNAAALKLEKTEFVGRRVMIVDQKANQFTGLMTIDENFIVHLEAQTGETSLDCKGQAMVDLNSQKLETISLMKCKAGQPITMSIELPKSEEEIVYLLQDGLTPATIEVKAQNPAPMWDTKVVYSGAVDIKRLAK